MFLDQSHDLLKIVVLISSEDEQATRVQPVSDFSKKARRQDSIFLLPSLWPRVWKIHIESTHRSIADKRAQKISTVSPQDMNILQSKMLAFLDGAEGTFVS